MTPTATEPPPPEPKPAGATPPHRLAEGLTGETAADQAAARAAGMLPAELLQPGEIIVLLLKPSAWFILLTPLRSLTFIAVLAMAIDTANTYLALSLGRQNILLAALTLILLRLFWQFLEWLSRVYVLTDRRIISVAGVLRIRVFETPLQKIQHTNLLFSLRERFFALGTIAFATAGSAFTESFWLMLSNPLQVHQKIIQTLNRYANRG
jgi:membrane protein YdbS with pleckstrin-like domain